jgi:O-antigen biosynthesis protein
MITIALTAYNQIEYTRLCLESILRHTNRPYKLVLIDNGSTDGTLLYFQSIAQRHPDTFIIHYEQNEIVEKIGNEYMQTIDTDYMIGVTNDTIVHAGWADNLIDALTSAPDIGMVGPRANCISGEQLLYPGATYSNLEEYQEVARHWAETHMGEYFQTQRVVGMLVALRLSAFKATGGYDVNLPTNGPDGAYGYSDDDLSAKMIKAGYRLLIANNVFIHHFGGVTVGNYNGLARNLKKYERIINGNHES